MKTVPAPLRHVALTSAGVAAVDALGALAGGGADRGILQLGGLLIVCSLVWASCELPAVHGDGALAAEVQRAPRNRAT